MIKQNWFGKIMSTFLFVGIRSSCTSEKGEDNIGIIGEYRKWLSEIIMVWYGKFLFLYLDTGHGINEIFYFSCFLIIGFTTAQQFDFNR